MQLLVAPGVKSQMSPHLRLGLPVMLPLGLLLVFVAASLTNFGLTRKWLLLSRAKVVNNTNSGQPLPAAARLPKLHVFGNTVSWGVVLALLLAGRAAVVVNRTVAGFRLRMLGLNPRTRPEIFSSRRNRQSPGPDPPPAASSGCRATATCASPATWRARPRLARPG